MSAIESNGTASRSVIERIERLEQELERKDERIEKLEDVIEEQDERIEELESRPKLEHRGGDGETLPATWVEYAGDNPDQPLGRLVDRNNEKGRKLESRVRDIERGEVDPGEVVSYSGGLVADDLLPLHQMWNTVDHFEPHEHGLSQNKEIAARLFPYLVDRAQIVEGVGRLPSPTIKETIEEEFGSDPELVKRLNVRDPNPNTVRRVMEYIADFGDDLFVFDDSNKTNRITFRRDEWVEYAEEIHEKRSEGAADGEEVDGDYSVVNSTASES